LALLSIYIGTLGPSWAGSADDATTADQVTFFEKRIRPVLADKCYKCHSENKKERKAGLRLDTKSGLLRGGDSGAAVVPGKPNESLLIEALRYESYEMPPDGKLPDNVIADFVAWISMGAPDPRTEMKSPIAKPSPATTGVDHWAFQPPQPQTLPEVIDEDWPRGAIDRFVLARLEGEDLEPSPRALSRSLARRLYFDLIGLPPTAEQVAELEADASYEAWTRLVDRLLSSPQLGERWARYWLDVARYADTKGYVFREDRNYPKAYTYRDWVIRAMNDDLPFDQFLVAQLAADQLDDPESLPAMGFLTLGRRFINNQHDIIDDRIDVVSRGLMGLTVTCARCHDHKYDPVPMADYYSLYGVFASCQEPKDGPGPLMLVDLPKPREPRIFLRGNSRNPGDQVPRQFLAVLSGDDRQPFRQGSGRMEMARAIASQDNPLTARVWVNRVWTHLFGRGLVRTASDFGVRSDPPSHPALLDHLTIQFIEHGWSTKWLIRQIVTSATYQQASDDRPDGRRADPENMLLWRMNRRRLDLEAMRDAILAAAGTLDTKMGGPSVRLTKSPFPTRRTVYGFIERQNLPGMFRTFDFANPDTHTPERPRTTVPQQALYLMNSPFAMEQAEALARRARRNATDDETVRIRRLYRFALAREPTAEEMALGRNFLKNAVAKEGEQQPAPSGQWQYGFGEYDADADRVTSFTPLPHFTGTAWQGGETLPDAKLGWVILNRDGGHPGNNLQHSAVRRFVCPADGVLMIEGRLEHSSDQGDGVRCRVVLGETGAMKEWTAKHGKTVTLVDGIDVAAGETVDLVTDCIAGPNHDSFHWMIHATLAPADGSPSSKWDSAADFRGPAPDPLDPWARYAHTLLMTNEFVFVD